MTIENKQKIKVFECEGSNLDSTMMGSLLQTHLCLNVLVLFLTQLKTMG